jgi:hypothetical protein
MSNTTTTKTTSAELMTELGLNVESKHIPTSWVEAYPQIKFMVTLKRGDNNVLTTEYSMGIAHLPSYPKGAPYNRTTSADKEAMDFELQHGRKAERLPDNIGGGFKAKTAPIIPDPVAVVYALVMDGYADDQSFSEWCDGYGYSDDSIKAKGMYDQCVESGRAMRVSLGTEGLQRLREAFQDY